MTLVPHVPQFRHYRSDALNDVINLCFSCEPTDAEAQGRMSHILRRTCISISLAEYTHIEKNKSHLAHEGHTKVPEMQRYMHFRMTRQHPNIP